MADGRRHDDSAALWEHAVSRRQLLRAGGLGASALAISTSALLAELTTSRVSASRPRPGLDRTGTTPGGTLSLALASILPTLDPSGVPTPGSVALAHLWAGRLYRVDQFAPREAITPELATALPAEVTPTTYRIPLRDDVTFHDGKQFGAADVVFTIEWVKDRVTAPYFAQFFDIIEGVEAVSTNEIELTLVAPTTLLNHRLTLVPILPDTLTPAMLELEPVGTGPYRVVSAVSDQSAILERFEDYAGERPPSYDRLEVDIVTDANARLAGLRSGQYKIVEDVPATAFESLTNADDVEVEAVDSYTWTHLYFHCGKPPFDDLRMRHAVMYAIDRDAITASTFFGQAEPAWAGLVAPSHPEFVDPDVVYRFDPDFARELLAEAGYADEAVPIVVQIPNDIEYLTSQGPIIEQNLRDVGFDPTLTTPQSFAAFGEMTAGNFNLTLHFADLSIFSPDLEFLLRFSFTGSVPSDYAHWEGDAVTELQQRLDDAVAAADETARRDALAQAQNIIQTEVPIGALHHKKQLTAWSPELSGFRPLATTGILLDGVSGGGE